jgi:hypothetical protein
MARHFAAGFHLGIHYHVLAWFVEERAHSDARARKPPKTRLPSME